MVASLLEGTKVGVGPKFSIQRRRYRQQPTILGQCSTMRSNEILRSSFKENSGWKLRPVTVVLVRGVKLTKK